MKDFNIGDTVTFQVTVIDNRCGLVDAAFKDGRRITMTYDQAMTDLVHPTERPSHMALSFRDQAALSALQGIIVAGPHDCTIPEIAYEAFNYAESLDAERKKRDEAA